MSDIDDGFVGSKNETTLFVVGGLVLVVRTTRVAFARVKSSLLVGATESTAVFFSDAPY